MDRVHLPPTSWLAALVIGLVSPDVTARQEPASATQQEFLDRLVALARSAPPPVANRGDHAIRGSVATEDGQPLEGVLVRAHRTDLPSVPYNRQVFQDAPPERPLERSLLSSASFWFDLQANTFDATTGADGGFVLDALPSGRFEVEAWKRGFTVEATQPDAFGRIAVDADATVSLVARPTHERTLVVRGDDGTPVEQAQLEIARVGKSGRSYFATWTPEQPTLRFPEGDWQVTASAGFPRSRPLSSDEATSHSKPTLVTVAAGSPDDTVVVELHGIPSIVGNLRTADGAAAPPTSVVAVRLGRGEEPDPKRLMEAQFGRDRDAVRASVNSNSARGVTYRLSPVAPGRWYLGLRDDRKRKLLASAIVDVVDGVVRHDFVLEAAEPTDEWRVRVLDPDGKLLRDCEFLSESRAENGSGGSGWPEARKTADGSFAFDRAAIRPVFTLLVKHPRFGRRALAVPPDAQTLELRFLAPVAPRLRLLDVSESAGDRGVAVEALDVSEEDERFPPFRFEGVAIRRDGTVDVGSMQPATYRFRIYLRPRPNPPRVPWGGNGEQEIAVATIALLEGAPSIELPVPKIAPLRISCAGVKEKTGFTLVPAGPSERDSSRARRYAETDADGLATFQDVPAGAFQIRGPVGATMLVDAPATDVVRFVADTIRVLLVSIRDRDGPLARAGLADGDRIVALDGREFEGREELERLRRSLPKERVTITVARGDKFLELVVPPDLLYDRNDLGGALIEAPR